MNFPWLGPISISIISSALSRCRQGRTPTHPWTWRRSYHGRVPSRPMSPFPFWWEVIWLQLIPGELRSVTLHSRGPTAQPSLKLLRLSCILPALHHFLPSFLVCTGNTFSPNPHSCLLTLPTTNFASFRFPLYFPLEAMLLSYRMLKTRREVGYNSVYFSFDSVLLPCSLILCSKSLTLF